MVSVSVVHGEQTGARRWCWFRPKAPAGLSLIELLIVVTIALIAAALTLPLLGQGNASKLRAAAGLLQADLAFAQNESIVHGDDPRMVIFDVAAGRYHLAAASQPATPLAHPLGGVDYVVQYGADMASPLAGVILSDVSAGGDDRVQFGALGGLDQAFPATVTLSAGTLSVTLSIDADTGEATVGPIE